MGKTQGDASNKGKKTDGKIKATVRTRASKNVTADLPTVQAVTQPDGKAETAYERLLRKVNDKKRKLQDEVAELNTKVAKKTGQADKGIVEEEQPVAASNATNTELQLIALSQEGDQIDTTVQFIEDDNYVDMSAEGLLTDFQSEVDSEVEEDTAEESLINNNAVIGETAQGCCQGSSSVAVMQLLDRNESNPGHVAFDEMENSGELTQKRNSSVEQSLAMLQSFMIKKG